MDEKRPKRRKDKDNPYTLSKRQDKHYLSFRDGQGVLRELLINKELEYDERIPDRCGSCSRCMNACPANALSLTEGLNSNSCISYQTIEKKGEISEEIRPALSGYVFGCDICQDVCPWNSKKSIPTKHEEFRPQDEILKWGKDEWLSVQQEEFNRIFKTSALRRAGFRKLRENISYEYGKNS